MAISKINWRCSSTGGSQNIKLCLILVSIFLYHTIFIQGVALFYWPGLKLPQSDVLQVKKHPHQSIFHLISTSLKIIVFLDLQINTTFSTIGFIAARHCQPPVWTIMTIYLFVIIYHLFIAALHCQPPVWTIWSVLQRQVWLWGEYREYCEYSPLLKRRVRWSLSLSSSFSEMIASSVFRHWLQVIGRYRILLQVRKSAEHSLNMPLRYQS